MSGPRPHVARDTAQSERETRCGMFLSGLDGKIPLKRLIYAKKKKKNGCFDSCRVFNDIRVRDRSPKGREGRWYPALGPLGGEKGA